MSTNPIRLTVWHEHMHERINETVAQLYPDGMLVVMKNAIVRVAWRAGDCENSVARRA